MKPTARPRTAAEALADVVVDGVFDETPEPVLESPAGYAVFTRSLGKKSAQVLEVGGGQATQRRGDDVGHVVGVIRQALGQHRAMPPHDALEVREERELKAAPCFDVAA